MNENDYFLAWCVYAGVALGCLLVFWWGSGVLWRGLREPLRVLVAVLLATPTVVDPARDLLAPAIAVLSLDMVFHVGASSVRALADLAMFTAIGAIAYALFVLGRWLINRGQPAEQGPQDPRTLRERLQEEDEDEYPLRARERIVPKR